MKCIHGVDIARRCTLCETNGSGGFTKRDNMNRRDERVANIIQLLKTLGDDDNNLRAILALQELPDYKLAELEKNLSVLRDHYLGRKRT